MVDNNFFFYMNFLDKIYQNVLFIFLYIIKGILIEFFVYVMVINFCLLWLIMFNYFFFGRGGGINIISLFILGL